MRSKVRQLARYYLAELWNNAEFRADWERVKRGELLFPDFETRWKLPRAITTAFLNELMSALSELGYGYEAEGGLLAQLWHGQPSPRFGNLLARIAEISTAREREHALCLPKFRFAPDADFELTSLLHRIQPETGGSRSIALQVVDGRLIGVLEPQLPEPPLKCLPEPMPAAETQAQYLARVDWGAAKREYRERFPNLRISEGALREHIEAILKGYYNACAELIPPTRYYNRTMSDTYLQLAARRIYLAVIEKKSWKEVAYETGLASFKKAREDTLKNMAILGIPAECVARRKTRKPRD
jgi:hypothetical protein